MDDSEEALDEAIAQMRSREQFADFLSLLLQDYDENLECWNNQDLRSFIQALAAFAATDGEHRQPAWQTFAEMLCTARAYMVD
jgi:hypothetical protein